MSHPAIGTTKSEFPHSNLEGNLIEIAEILVAGLTRLSRLKSSGNSAQIGESSVGFTAQPSGDASTFSLGVDA